jgi:hypothetical protein
MRQGFVVLVLGGALLAACGETYTDPGGGSGTLLVVANLQYAINGNNTRVDLQLTQNGATVDNAEVAIKDGDSDVTATIAQRPNGRYQYDFAGYHRRIELAVTSGSDTVHGKIEGPGRHQISSPANNDNVNLGTMGSNLEVKWSTKDGLRADQVTVQLAHTNYQSVLTSDDGTTNIPKGNLLPRLGDDEQIQVLRANQVSLSGGTPGSTLTLGYSVSNTFVIQN